MPCFLTPPTLQSEFKRVFHSPFHRTHLFYISSCFAIEIWCCLKEDTLFPICVLMTETEREREGKRERGQKGVYRTSFNIILLKKEEIMLSHAVFETKLDVHIFTTKLALFFFPPELFLFVFRKWTHTCLFYLKYCNPEARVKTWLKVQPQCAQVKR